MDIGILDYSAHTTTVLLLINTIILLDDMKEVYSSMMIIPRPRPRPRPRRRQLIRREQESSLLSLLVIVLLLLACFCQPSYCLSSLCYRTTRHDDEMEFFPLSPGCRDSFHCANYATLDLARTDPDQLFCQSLPDVGQPFDQLDYLTVGPCQQVETITDIPITTNEDEAIVCSEITNTWLVLPEDTVDGATTTNTTNSTRDLLCYLNPVKEEFCAGIDNGGSPPFFYRCTSWDTIALRIPDLVTGYSISLQRGSCDGPPLGVPSPEEDGFQITEEIINERNRYQNDKNICPLNVVDLYDPTVDDTTAQVTIGSCRLISNSGPAGCSGFDKDPNNGDCSLDFEDDPETINLQGNQVITITKINTLTFQRRRDGSSSTICLSYQKETGLGSEDTCQEQCFDFGTTHILNFDTDEGGLPPNLPNGCEKRYWSIDISQPTKTNNGGGASSSAAAAAMNHYTWRTTTTKLSPLMMMMAVIIAWSLW